MINKGISNNVISFLYLLYMWYVTRISSDMHEYAETYI